MTLDDFDNSENGQNDDSYSFHKNDAAWQKIFDKLPIMEVVEEGGVFDIKASDMKGISSREPRLLAKFESKNTIPEIFKKNRLCIMPCESRGNYVIGHFDAFLDVSNEKISPEAVSVNAKYDLLDPCNLTKEPTVILSALNYGVLKSIANDEDVAMTDFGREYTGAFEYHIDNMVKDGLPYNISVNRSQLEMDGVFESENYILNIEAKMGLREDFLARQLYYPYRMLSDRSRKNILNLFVTYSTGALYIHSYKIEDPMNYNSFKLQGSYQFNFFEELSVHEVATIIEKTETQDVSSDLTFPQADAMQKVFDSLEIIRDSGEITTDELADKLSVVSRQGEYYASSCRYLGLADRGTKRPYQYYLNQSGKNLLNSPMKKRIVLMIEALCRHEVFKHFLSEYIEQGEPPEKEEITQWIRDNIRDLDPEKGTTARRAQTVKKWIEWVLDNCNADV